MPYEEADVGLDPGDTLLVFTDGLVEVGDETIEVEEVLGSLDRAGSVEQVVEHLVDRVRGQRSDDVTVLALRRTGGGAGLKAHPAEPQHVGARRASPEQAKSTI